MSKKQIKKDYNIDKIKELIENGILNYTFRMNHRKMPDDIFRLFLNSIVINSLDDYSLLSDDRIRALIDWNSIPRKKLVRLFTRDVSIIDKIDFDNFDFSVSELENFLKFHPEFINKLNIDFETITSKEALILLLIDKTSHHYIDFGFIKFKRSELQQLIKQNIHEEEIMNKLDFNEFDNFICRYILKKTGTKYLDKINLKKFNVLDWINIIEHTPSLYKYCNLNLFIQGDCYYLTKLAAVSNNPEVFDLINKNRKSISGLGWQKLLLLDFQKYSPICNWESLKSFNFKKLKNVYPNIEQYRINPSEKNQ